MPHAPVKNYKVNKCNLYSSWGVIFFIENAILINVLIYRFIEHLKDDLINTAAVATLIL